MADIAPAGGTLDGDDIVALDGDKPAAPVDPDLVEIGEGEDDTQGLPKAATEQGDGTVLLRLAQPVRLKFKRGGVVREEAFEALTFHRLTGADMRVIAQAERGMVDVTAIARSTRMDLGRMNALYDRMDAADTVSCGRVVAHFLGAGTKTGR
jgi:hypothetical protein